MFQAAAGNIEAPYILKVSVVSYINASIYYWIIDILF